MLLFEPKTLLNKMNLIAANIENRIMHFNKFSYNKKIWQGIHTAFKAYMDFICSIIEDRDIWSFMYLMEGYMRTDGHIFNIRKEKQTIISLL